MDSAMLEARQLGKHVASKSAAPLVSAQVSMDPVRLNGMQRAFQDVSDNERHVSELLERGVNADRASEGGQVDETEDDGALLQASSKGLASGAAVEADQSEGASSRPVRPGPLPGSRPSWLYRRGKLKEYCLGLLRAEDARADGYSCKEMTELTGSTLESVRCTLENIVKKGLAERVGHGVQGNPYRYRIRRVSESSEADALEEAARGVAALNGLAEVASQNLSDGSKKRKLEGGLPVSPARNDVLMAHVAAQQQVPAAMYGMQYAPAFSQPQLVQQATMGSAMGGQLAFANNPFMLNPYGGPVQPNFFGAMAQVPIGVSGASAPYVQQQPFMAGQAGYGANPFVMSAAPPNQFLPSVQPSQ